MQVRVLREPNLGQHHNKAIMALMFIVRGLQDRCVQFLEQIVPAFLEAMRNYEESLRDNLFTQLGHIVRSVR